MEQIAQETGLNLISYSMAHQTRESAMGLPNIVTRNYIGKDEKVSEYTMSEIIANIYNTMEDTGIREGILFLDEINCVSTSLAPIMLQFLQYKIFGLHQIPPGWVIVTAGNPPEYNRSVVEFDMATWDRFKRVDCEAVLSIWMEYAYYAGVHPCIMTYLKLHPEHYYLVHPDEKEIVTSRAWEDLSEMMQLYEEIGIAVDDTLELGIHEIRHRNINASRASASVGVGRGGDGTHRATDSDGATRAVIARANGADITRATLGVNLGHTVSDGDVAASCLIGTTDSGREPSAIGIDGAALNDDVAAGNIIFGTDTGTYVTATGCERTASLDGQCRAAWNVDTRIVLRESTHIVRALEDDGGIAKAGNAGP
jgi:hypothetical protein